MSPREEWPAEDAESLLDLEIEALEREKAAMGMEWLDEEDEA